MLASGKPIHTSNSCYTATNLIIPDGTYWTAAGTIITQQVGATGFLIDASSATNFYIEGLRADGTNYSSPINRPLGTRSGFAINQFAGGGQIINCNASGFDDYGFFVTGTNTGSGGHELPLAELVGCRAWNNGIGLMLLSSGSATRGEYIDLIDFQSMTNTIRVEPDAGNVTFTGGKICDNQLGVRMANGTPNGYHGVFSGVLINHNISGSVSITGDGVGELFDGCCFLAGALTMSLTNCTGVVFNDCYFDVGTTFTSVGGSHGYNIVENSLYVGQWSQSVVVNNLDGTLLFFNNNSRDTMGDSSPNNLSSLGTYSTNFNPNVSSAGYTNHTGRNQLLNIQGAGGSYVFYMRSGPGGTNAASVPLWTNSVVPSGSLLYLGANCGVQVVSGSQVQLQLSDQ